MALADKVVVRLSGEQRDALDGLRRAGTCPAAMRRRAAILLRADAGGRVPPGSAPPPPGEGGRDLGQRGQPQGPRDP
jgi:hypothetical protein